ncbi:hypothetical protein D3C78_1720730 [compost metagenome]
MLMVTLFFKESKAGKQVEHDIEIVDKKQISHIMHIKMQFSIFKRRGMSYVFL